MGDIVTANMSLIALKDVMTMKMMMLMTSMTVTPYAASDDGMEVV